MKVVLFLLSVVNLLSCGEKKELSCNLETFKNDNLKGRVAIFFKRPVSGSTYQIFMIPICNVSMSEIIGESSPKLQTFNAFSFSLTSDDERFKYIKERSEKLNLLIKEPRANQPQYINYTTLTVDLSDSEIWNYDTDTNLYIIKTTGDKEIQFNYKFISFVKFKIEV